LEVIFPDVHGQTPLTRVVWEAHRGSVEWRTLHIYPQSNGAVCVHSKSVFNYNQ
jgi:hypothetical protein